LTKSAARWINWAVLCLLAAILAVLVFINTPFGNQWRDRSPDWVKITSAASLVHVGSNDSFAITKEGLQAAKLVLEFLEQKNPNAGKAASKIYDQIIPRENYGGEYTALQWFCQYLLTPEHQRQTLLSDPYVTGFYKFFAENDFANLKEYLKRKYDLVQLPDEETEKARNRRAFLEDFILFNNPRREEWEKTSQIVQSLKIKPGQAIADIGSGPGYYTFKFARLVGDQGRVFAIDTLQDHLDYVSQLSKQYDIQNVQPVNNNPGSTIRLDANQVDLAFMCSLYHNIYGMAKDKEINSLVASIRKALKPEGTLIIVDNALVNKSELPYHGPYIAQELIIGQLKHYGFRFVEQHAFIPQRYVLVFKKV
jgi:ubiquinone/menaquinone biosynthesis C-methylase UbiE